MHGASLTTVVRDEEGNLWFGTTKGILKFDGYELRPNVVPDLDAHHITSASCIGDEIWFGTARKGLFRVGPHGQVRQSYTGRADGGTLKSSRIARVFADRAEGVWVSSFRGGLQRYDPTTNQFGAVDSEMTVTAIGQRADSEDLWIGTLAGQLVKLRSEDQTMTEVRDLGSEVTSIAQQADCLWVGTRGNGLFAFDSDGQLIVNERHHAGMPEALLSDEVYSLWVDETSRLWVGTDGGLSCRNTQLAPFTHTVYASGIEHGLMPGPVTVLYEHLKALWVGGSQGEISRLSLDRRRFPILNRSLNGLVGKMVYAGVTDRNGHQWFATENGLIRYDDTTGKWLSPVTRGALSRVRATTLLATGDGSVWVGSLGDGIHRWQPSKNKLETYDKQRGTLPHNHVLALCQDSLGRVWAGTAGGGLSEWRTDRFERVALGNPDPSFVNALWEDPKGRLWVGAMSGIMILSADRQNVIPFPELSTQEQLSVYVSSIVGDQEHVYIGTEGHGLLVLDLDLGIKAVYNESTSALTSNVIDSLLIGDLGDVWMATRHGLSRLSLPADSIEVFDGEDGLQGRRFYRGAAWKDKEGLLYFGGANGVNEVDPELLRMAEPVSRPVLLGFELNGEEVSPEPGGLLEKPLMATRKLILPYNSSDRIGFTYGTLDYANPLKSRFRYRLEGLDEEMSLPTSDRRAAYTNLQPRDYRFVVHSSPDGVNWHPDEASIEFVVVAPWYHRSWAKVGYALVAIYAIVALAFIAFRRQVAKARRQRERLELDNRRIEAALARQLQGSVLLNRTAKEIRHGLSRQHVFSATLRELTKHFGVDRSFIMLCNETEERDGFAFSLGAAHTSNGVAPIEADQLPLSNSAWFESVLARDKAVAVPKIEDASAISADWPELALLKVKSMLAVRTSYLDKPNGVIFLQQCSSHREWKTEELLLIDQVATQVGLAIAQSDLQAREEQHRSDLEDAKRTAEVANDAKSEFLAKITHELRTPLNAILGFCQLLSQDDETSPQQQDTLAVINSSGEHLLGMINDVLDMSKIEADCLVLNEEAFDVQELADTLRGMFRFRAEEKGISLLVEVDQNVPKTLRADAGKLRQTLINLAGNAIKFTETGTVSIHVSADGNETYRFEVRDTGKGIAPEEIDGLFDKFFQAEAGRLSMQGTGLGLAISRKFVEFMGGDIWVESQLQRGTIFSFTLPMEAVEKEGDVSVASEEATRSRMLSLQGASQFRVLVAEDQVANRLLLTTILRKSGFQVIEAVDGKDAVAKWEEHRPDLVFMDHNMPKMNGDEATSYLVQRYADENPRVIALTASALEDIKLLMTEAGCIDFLTKPYTADGVIDALVRHLPLDEAAAA